MRDSRFDIVGAPSAVRHFSFELGSTIGKLLEEAKPESVYFDTLGTGERSGMIVVDLKDASEIVKYAERWFMAFGASVNFEPVMTPADLEAAAPHFERVAKH